MSGGIRPTGRLGCIYLGQSCSRACRRRCSPSFGHPAQRLGPRERRVVVVLLLLAVQIGLWVVRLVRRAHRRRCAPGAGYGSPSRDRLNPPGSAFVRWSSGAAAAVLHPPLPPVRPSIRDGWSVSQYLNLSTGSCGSRPACLPRLESGGVTTVLTTACNREGLRRVLDA